MNEVKNERNELASPPCSVCEHCDNWQSEFDIYEGRHRSASKDEGYCHKHKHHRMNGDTCEYFTQNTMTTNEQIIQSGGRLYLVEWWESASGHPLILRAVSEHGESIDFQDHPGIKDDLLFITSKTMNNEQHTNKSHQK